MTQVQFSSFTQRFVFVLAVAFLGSAPHLDLSWVSEVGENEFRNLTLRDDQLQETL